MQLRLFVAPMSAEELATLLAAPEAKGLAATQTAPDSDLERVARRVPHFLKAASKVLAVAAVIATVGFSAWRLGDWFVQRPKAKETEKPEKPPGWLSKVELAGKVNNTDVELRIQPTPATVTPKPSLGPTPNPVQHGNNPPIDERASGPPTVTEGQRAPPNWGRMTLAGLLLLAGTLRVMAIRDLKRIDNSPVFTKTLNEFTPCVRAACTTPRAVKQLINRVRLYAMLLRHWTLNWEDQRAADGRLANHERNIVIFGILEKLCPTQLRAALAQPSSSQFSLEQIDSALAPFNVPAADAIRALASPATRQDFDRLVRAVEITES